MNSTAIHSNVHHCFDHPNNSERDNSGDKRDQDTRQALFEAYKLLEEYAPVWYLESLSQRIREALDAYDR